MPADEMFDRDRAKPNGRTPFVAKFAADPGPDGRRIKLKRVAAPAEQTDESGPARERIVTPSLERWHWEAAPGCHFMGDNRLCHSHPTNVAN